MFVALNIILDAIKEYDHETHIAALADVQVSRISILPNQEKLEKRQNVLYVGYLSDYLQNIRNPEGNYFLCVRNRLRDDYETPQQMTNTIIVNQNINLSDLYSEIQEMFYSVIEWKMNMAEALASGCRLQDLLEQSKSVIGNYIAVNDAAFRLIANTANIECDDPICMRMIERGYHPESTIEMFRKTNRFSFWETTDFYIDTGHLYSPYTIVGRVFRINDDYVAHAVMTCNNHETTPGLLELYDILCSYIYKFIARDYEGKKSKIIVYNSILGDLISGNVTDYGLAIEKFEANDFRILDSLYIFKLPLNNIVNTLVGKIVEEFAETLPKTIMTIYANQLVMLFSFRDAERELSEAIQKTRQLTEKYNLRCGISARFDQLELCQQAYKQADSALTYGTRLMQGTLDNDTPVCEAAVVSFEEIFHYCLLNDSHDVIKSWRNSAYGKKLLEIYEYDKKYNSNNLKLLFTFLKCERRARETGELMHLHRNSVAYRIEHLQELFDIDDLDNPNTRIKLLMSFMMMNLYGLFENR